MTLSIATIPSEVRPGETIELVRDNRGLFRLRRVTTKGRIVKGYTMEVPRRHAEQFVDAARRAGGEVFHAVDDPEPGTVIRYIGDEEQPLVYTKPRKGTAAEALYQLLVEHPNETVTRMMVEQRLGRRLGRSALSKAARRLPPWMPVVANYGRGGGFIFAQRTDAPNGSTCLTCTAGRDEGRECALLGGQTAQPHKTTCGAYRARRS